MLRLPLLISIFVITGCTSIGKVDNKNLFEQAMLVNPTSTSSQASSLSVTLKFYGKEIKLNNRHRVIIFDLFKGIENNSAPRAFLTGGGDLGTFLKRVESLTALTPRIAKIDYHFSPDADKKLLKVELFKYRAGDIYE